MGIEQPGAIHIEPSEKTILVVDDSEINRTIISHHLTRADYVVLSAESGHQALDQLQKQPVDLILLDVMMPEIDGFETLKRIRETNSMSNLPVIMITALNQSKDVIKALSLGANDYITKPIDTAVAMARIRTQLSLLESERALRESEERYALAAQGANDGLWDWNLRTGEVYYSPRWRSMLGYDGDTISRDIHEWFVRVHPDDLPRVKSEIDRHLKGETSHFASEHRVLHKNETYLWVFCRGIAVRDKQGFPYRMAGSQTDITKHGMHDALTGLPTRELFLHSLTRATRRQEGDDRRRFAIHYLDLDRFKMINDSFGHHVGDHILTQIVKRLEQCISQQDTLARLEGDDFAILQNQVEDVDDAARLARRIQEGLAVPFEVANHEISMEVSSGIVLADHGADKPEELLRKAHTALFRAKARGKGCFEIFDQLMESEAKERLRLESSLRQALKNDELSLLFQPQFDLATSRIVGCEALLRWLQGGQQWIGPDRFIPIAEETGLIIPIGDWVLENAMRQARVWMDAGFPGVRVAVNLSAKQFNLFDLVERIEGILEATGFDAHLLELEITESILMENYRVATKTLHELHELGVSIAIDDFGTGYSSLGYLKRFPIDCLKVDKSFIKDIPKDADDAAITSAIVAMAHHLKLKVIAEGVEHEDQMHFLNSLKCEEAQGYFYGKPMSAEALLSLLRELAEKRQHA